VQASECGIRQNTNRAGVVAAPTAVHIDVVVVLLLIVVKIPFPTSAAASDG
jgi:hypothetical protein